MQMSKNSIRVRFPNESFYDEINIKNIIDFKISKEYDDEIFGYLNSSFVAIKKEDYKKLKTKEMNLKKKIEFEKFREEWTEKWYDYYRLLDIDFEAFMRMKGLTIEEYKHLNNEELWKNML